VASACDLFDVEVLLEAEESPDDARELVTDALAELGTLDNVRGQMGVSSSDRGVTVRFEDVAAPGDDEGRFRLQEVLPVVQALINAIVERLAERTSGAATNPRLVIEVQPARPHGQEELRHS
jgi:hypothetical protein